MRVPFLLAIGLMMLTGAASALDAPLPRPRPPGTAPLPFIPPAQTGMQGAAEVEEALGCRMRLSLLRAVAPSVGPLSDPGGCGAPDAVRLEAVMLRDGSRVALMPPPTLRCSMAGEIAAWVRDDLARLAEGLGSRLRSIENFDAYSCRGRNRVVGARMSEHGRANALDVRSLTLATGISFELTDRSLPRGFREAVRASVCERFTTVLGPGSDGYHENHVHLDLAFRRSGYRICQWEVKDVLPEVPLPPVRPSDAADRRAKD